MTNTSKPQANTLEELVDLICLRDKSLVVPAVKEQIQALITEARIDELEKLDRSSWEAISLVREIKDRLTQLKENK